ncbi:protein of unknown function [Paraburkholderia kururiensis]
MRAWVGSRIEHEMPIKSALYARIRIRGCTIWSGPLKIGAHVGFIENVYTPLNCRCYDQPQLA